MVATSTFDSQLPAIVDVMIEQLRAGYSLSQIFNRLGQTEPDPAGALFRQLMVEVQAGTGYVQALEDQAPRLASAHLGRFVAILRTQLAEGGNLADRLEPLRDDLQAG